MENTTVIAYTKLTLDKSYSASFQQGQWKRYASTSTQINVENPEMEFDGDVQLTQHALRLAEPSLVEGWENEDDTYWESFLNK
ncbi:hypothetical protein [Lunatibacter salilacus]|uniref:hypothetical protein n=1 Tax=Lunatibacter salilacus TaxID=2483804 RepID=UPI00131C5E2A|nr:hypothetical protein [Lunatibacter salilacus]